MGYIFATRACIDNRKETHCSNMSSTRSRNIVNFSPLTAEICSVLWGTPVNFNEFCILASLLHRHRATEVNQTLHDVWPSPALVHYIHFWGLLPLTELCQEHNLLCVQILRFPVLAALLHGTRAVGVSQTLRRSAEGAIYILQGGHHDRHRPTF